MSQTVNFPASLSGVGVRRVFILLCKLGDIMATAHIQSHNYVKNEIIERSEW